MSRTEDADGILMHSVGSRNQQQSAARSTSTAILLAVFLPLLAVYALTAQWSRPYHIDPLTNAITGWYIGNEGTAVAEHHEVLATPGQRGNLGWFVESPVGTISQYPPGAALWAGAFYAITPGGLTMVEIGGTNKPDLGKVEVPLPPLWPATLSAVIASAGAAAVLSLVFLRMTGERNTAIGAGLAFGLATTAWSVASAMSWTHGPAMLAIALALLAAQRERWAWCGTALGFAVLTRPHLAVIAAVIGFGVSVVRRRWEPVLAIGAWSGAGLLALLAYNYSTWGKLTISGGYGDGFTDQFVGADLSWFLANLWGALFDPSRGLLIWAPFLVVLIAGALIVRRLHPDWAVWAALGGVLYLLIQLRANRFSGGDGHFAYRYPLETLTAVAPILYLGYTSWVRPRRVARMALEVGLAVGVMGQILGAVGGIIL